MSTSKTNAAAAIDSLKCQANRVSIPAEEPRDFAANGERRPVAARYPRDPSLNLQLVRRSTLTFGLESASPALHARAYA